MSFVFNHYNRSIIGRLAGVMRVAKHKFEDMIFHARIETHDFGGRPLQVTIADRTAAEWYGVDAARPRDFDLLAGRGLGAGGLVFDIGAHQGVVAMMLANEVGESGKVVCIEAVARNAEIARHNAGINRYANIEVLHAAIARADAPVLFSQKRNGEVAQAAGAGVKSVEGLSIDTLSARYGAPGLVYLDVEGYELEALKGASKTLASNASWLIETHGDADLGKFGACNADVVAVFDESFDLFWSPDNAETDFAPLAHGAPVSNRFFLAAIKKVSTAI
ncbi:MAG: FkbM family methyltransferase [Rhodoblastus sp.]